MQAAIGHAPHTPAPGDHDYAVTGIDSRKLGMWGFLASECLFFGALISSHLLYRSRAPEGVHIPHDVYDIPYTSVSSFVLLMSSLTMVLALAAIQRGDHRRSRTWLLTTALLGAVFVSGQVYEFTAFSEEGLKLSTNLFSTTFYVLTGFHGVHVTVGVLMLLSLVGLSSARRLPEDPSFPIEMVGLYWHFVDIVWIVIFTVVYLVPTPSPGGPGGP
jgi:cytochrome c oxidase subunit 3/cytochrome o ubiquinol oxidase subunit 3